jgi:hypothetical protein
LHWLQLRQLLKLLISLRNQTNLLSHFFLLEVDRSYHNTQFRKTFVLLLVFCRFSCTVLDRGHSPQIFIDCYCLTLLAHFIFVCHILTYRLIFSVQIPSRFSCLCAQICSTVATIFCSSWDECPTSLWISPTFSEHSNMSRDNLAAPVAAAATAQAAIKHFRHFCEGHLFQLWTDHKPLVTAISRVSTPISPRQQRHLVFISEFNVQLLYLPGLKNVVADFMPRPPPPSTGTVTATAAADPVDFEEMAAEQSRCPETQRLLCSTSLKLAFRQTGAQRLAGDISTGTFRPIVPLKF